MAGLHAGRAWAAAAARCVWSGPSLVGGASTRLTKEPVSACLGMNSCRVWHVGLILRPRACCAGCWWASLGLGPLSPSPSPARGEGRKIAAPGPVGGRASMAAEDVGQRCGVQHAGGPEGRGRTRSIRLRAGPWRLAWPAVQLSGPEPAALGGSLAVRPARSGRARRASAAGSPRHESGR